MIEMEDFDAGSAYEWAIHHAMESGCTCDDEPTVALIFCPDHGVHLTHAHEPSCTVAKVEKHRSRIQAAPLN